jgi:hypothetical protein
MDGGFVVVGESKSTIDGLTTFGGNDAIIIKYDGLGNKIWSKNFGGLYDDCFYSVRETNDGGLVAVGFTYSTNISGLTNLGSYDSVIVKYDNLGNRLWAKNFGGSKGDLFYAVTEANDGGYVAVGYSQSTDVSGLTALSTTDYYDAIIVKYDSLGNKVWAKNFGGSMNDSFNSIIEISDNNFIAVGATRSIDVKGLSALSNDSYYDAIIVKYDNNGNRIWEKNFGGSYSDCFNSIIKTNDEELVAVGYTNSIDIEDIGAISGTPYLDSIIVKFDINGDRIWAKNFGGSNEDYFKSVIEMNDGNLIAIGTSKSIDIEGLKALSTTDYYDAIIVNYDKNGNKIWARNFGGSKGARFESIIEGENGEYIVVGYSESGDMNNISNLGKDDAIIIKFKSDIEIVFEQTESNPTLQNISYARALVNNMSESIEKDQLQERLNNIYAVEMEIAITPLTATANIDMHVKFKNALSLSLSTSSITFDDFSGIEDLIIEDALSVTVSSSLDYSITSFLVGNIVSSKGNVLDKSIFNLRASGDTSYKNYSSSNALTLFTNQTAGNNRTHKIDMMLKGNIAHTADVYKAVLKISIEQI